MLAKPQRCDAFHIYKDPKTPLAERLRGCLMNEGYRGLYRTETRFYPDDCEPHCLGAIIFEDSVNTVEIARVFHESGKVVILALVEGLDSDKETEKVSKKQIGLKDLSSKSPSVKTEQKKIEKAKRGTKGKTEEESLKITLLDVFNPDLIWEGTPNELLLDRPFRQFVQ